MTINNCEIILKIAENGSLARTSEFFSYTPSRISQILSSTESELGIRLFTRSKSGLVPTKECQALLPVLREMQSSKIRLDDELARIKSLDVGVINIGAYTSLSCHWLPERLKAFGELYPGIRFDVRLGHRDRIAEWVREGSADIGLMEEPSGQDLDFSMLSEDPFAVTAPLGHPLAAGKGGITLENLASEQFIFLEPEDNIAVEEAFRSAGIVPKIRYRIKDDYTIMSMVESGLGISILPKLVLSRTPYRIEMLELEPQLIRRLGFVTKKGIRRSFATEKFLEFCLK